MRRIVLKVEDERLPEVLEALKRQPGVAEIAPDDGGRQGDAEGAVRRALREAILKAARPEALERFGPAGVIRDTAFQGGLEWLLPFGRGRVAVLPAKAIEKVPLPAGLGDRRLAEILGGRNEPLVPRPGTLLAGVVVWPEDLAERLGMERNIQNRKQEAV